MEYLGYKIAKNKVSLTEEKQVAISKLARPESRKELLSFLALAQYYGEFIKGFATLIRPLRELSRATVFQWTDKAVKAFNEVKRRLTTPPERGGLVLVLPQWDRQFVLDTDASKYALGAVLSQWDGKKDRTLRPIMFISRKLVERQSRYIACPPSCVIPTSNDARVRVEVFWNNMASVCP